jgi:hypothetical protein
VTLVGAAGAWNGGTHWLRTQEFNNMALLFGLIFTSTGAIMPPANPVSRQNLENRYSLIRRDALIIMKALPNRATDILHTFRRLKLQSSILRHRPD